MNAITPSLNPYITFLFCFFILFRCSQSDDKDCHSGFNLGEESAVEIQIMSDALVAYVQDLTPANYENYKIALNIYVDALDEYEECAIQYGDGDDWNEANMQTRASIN